MTNIFFDLADLKSCGDNVIIGKTARIRYPELVEIGDNVIIDDFTYISTSLMIDSFVHISSGCKLIGGSSSCIKISSFSTLSPNVVLAACSDDYISGIATPLVDKKYKGNVSPGIIRLDKHCIVGSNSTVLQDVILHEGAAVGAQSLVNKDLDAWSLFAGIPAKLLRKRDKAKITHLENKFTEGYA